MLLELVSAMRPRQWAKNVFLLPALFFSGKFLELEPIGLVAIGVAVFTLSKNSMQVFQHETRISGAHLAATLGMNRLTADLQRASYMSWPTIRCVNAPCCRVGSTTRGIRAVKHGNGMAQTG